MQKAFKSIGLLILDSLLIGISVYAAYLLRFEFKVDKKYIETFDYVIPLYIICIISWFVFYKIYKRMWRYASVGDMLSILKGSIAGTVTVYLLHNLFRLVFEHNIVIPRSVHLMSMIIIFFAIGASRLSWRLTKDNYVTLQPNHKRTLVVGAGEAGVIIVRELKHSNTDYYPIAFIDDSKEKQNFEVLGVPVVGTLNDLKDVTIKYDIHTIIIAMPSATSSAISEIIQACKETKCQIKIIPRMHDLISGNVSVSMIRDVDFEDLLGRDPVKVDLQEISSYLTGRVVMVTGAGGSIGSEICRQVIKVAPEKLILLDSSENNIYDIELELRSKMLNVEIEPVVANIQNEESINHVFERFRPNVVFHAAAHKHVPLMEKNPEEAIRNNVFGTLNVAESAHRYQTQRFVLISTDKAVNPTSVMGVTKRIAEMIIQNLNTRSNTKFAAVRFGNVLGSRGSVIPLFQKQIKMGGPVTVTHPDMVRYFMTIPEAVQLVIQAGALAEGGEVFILDMGKPVKIVDLAYDLIRLSGFEPDKDIKVVFTGMRPGEKLFEELLTKEEGAIATKHDRIFVGKPEVMPTDTLYRDLEKLRKATSRDVLALLRKVVPAYVPGIEQDTSNYREAYQASLEVVASLENAESVKEKIKS